ncbi:MAG: HlyD family secretion protein [Planctomycetota bacterium]|jgi:HlyD family secretion protein
MDRTVKRVLTVIVAVSVVFALVWAMAPRPIEVETALVTRGALRVTVDEDGKTRVRERYVVSAPLTGRLLRIELDPGDAVSARSTLLAAIEPRDPDLLDPRAAAEAEARVFGAEATLKRVEPDVASVSAEFELAKSEADRMRRVFESNAASRKELDDALLLERTRAERLRSTEFSRQIAEFELKQARAALLRTRSDDQTPRTSDPFEIHSPCQGVVLRVFQESTAGGVATIWPAVCVWSNRRRTPRCRRWAWKSSGWTWWWTWWTRRLSGRRWVTRIVSRCESSSGHTTTWLKRLPGRCSGTGRIGRCLWSSMGWQSFG